MLDVSFIDVLNTVRPYAGPAIGGAMMLGGAYAALPEPDFKHGWLTMSGAKRYKLTGGSIPLGTMGRVFKETITAPKESHILAIGPTGYGKTKSLIENIIFSDTENSMVVFDLKGDLLTATAAARSKLGPVYVLDPSSETTNHYNPYVDVPVGDVAMIKDLQGWLIAQTPFDSSAAQYYNSTTLRLLSAATEHVLNCDGYHKSMIGVYTLLSGGKWVDALKNSPIDSVRELAESFPSYMVEKTQGSINALLGWLDYPGVKRIMSSSDLRFTDMQSAPEPVTIYIRLPEQSKQTIMPFARVIIGMLTMTLMKSETLAMDGAVKQRGITFIIDEVKQLALPKIDTFLSAGRSFGGRVVLASQLISEIRKLYEGAVEGNCNTQLFTRTQSVGEAEHISETLPKHIVRKQVVTRSHSSHGSGTSVRYDEREEPLLTPTGVMKLPKHTCLVGVVEGHPVKLRTIYSPKKFADIRDKPFTVAKYCAVHNPWDDVCMKGSYKPKAPKQQVARRIAK